MFTSVCINNIHPGSSSHSFKQNQVELHLKTHTCKSLLQLTFILIEFIAQTSSDGLKMGDGKWVITGILIISVVLTSETNMIDEQSDTCVYVEVNYDYGHNSAEMSCEAPDQPVNGGYVTDADVGGNRYNTRDKIRYYCNGGHQLIGQAIRTCNGTSKKWEPEEPYCQPEYIGHLMRMLNGIEDQIRVIEQRITTVENNTLQIDHNISILRSEAKTTNNRISAMNNTMSAMNNRVSSIDNKISAIDNNMSAICNISGEQSLRWQIHIERLAVCTEITKPIDEDTVSKCMTMQSGVRNGSSVSVYKWVIEDYKSKVTSSSWVPYNSTIFYHTVPGPKLKLRGYIDNDSEIRAYLSTEPGEYDDQLTWPLSNKHELTVLTNNGSEVTQRSFSGDLSTCQFYQAEPGHEPSCYDEYSEWQDVRRNKKHILSDDSVVMKLYIYD